MENIIFEYFNCLIYVVALTISTLFLSKEDYSLKRLIIIIPLYTTINCFIIINSVTTIFGYLLFNTLIIVSDFIFCCVLTKNNNYINLFYSSVFYVMFHSIQIIFIYFFSVLTNITFLENYILSISTGIIITVLVTGLTVILIVLLNKLKLLPSIDILKQESLLFILLNILMIYMLFIVFYTSMKEIINYDLIITIILFVTWSLFYRILISYTNTRIKNEQLMVQEISNNYVDKYIDFYKQESDKLRKIKHDIKNHKLLLENMNNEMLNEYIGDIFDDLDKQYIQTGNLFVDSCLYIKSQEYPSIIFDYDISINGLKINEKDLNSILFNLIDNACNEALKTDLKVNIELKYIRNVLKIKVVNKCVSKPSFVTMKGIGHGYGLKIIASIVDKYNGNIFYDFHDNIISFNISLTV